MQRYTQGFIFAPGHEEVLLIEKDRGPRGIIGKWIGLGGKLEPNESLHQCMARETHEEAGLMIPPDDWKHFCSFGDGETFEVTCFATTLKEWVEVEGQESEIIHWVDVDMLLEGYVKTTRHVPYLLLMAMDERISFPPPFIKFNFTADNDE